MKQHQKLINNYFFLTMVIILLSLLAKDWTTFCLYEGDSNNGAGMEAGELEYFKRNRIIVGFFIVLMITCYLMVPPTVPLEPLLPVAFPKVD